MEKEGRIEGLMEECQAGRPIWNPKEKTLYLTGPNCLRKVVGKPDGTRWVEVVAGVPGNLLNDASFEDSEAGASWTDADLAERRATLAAAHPDRFKPE